MPSQYCASAMFGSALTAASNCAFASGILPAFQRMTPWLNDCRRAGAPAAPPAAPPAGGAALASSIAFLLASAARSNFFSRVVDVREPVVRLGEVRLQLDRLLVGGLGFVVLLGLRPARCRCSRSTRRSSATAAITSLNLAIASSVLPSLLSATPSLNALVIASALGLRLGDFFLAAGRLPPPPPASSLMSSVSMSRWMSVSLRRRQRILRRRVIRYLPGYSPTWMYSPFLLVFVVIGLLPLSRFSIRTVAPSTGGVLRVDDLALDLPALCERRRRDDTPGRRPGANRRRSGGW